MSFYQIVLPIFTLVYLLQVFVIQSWIQWKTTGIKPYVFGSTDSPHDYCGKVYRLMVIGTWVSIAFYSFFPAQYEFLLPCWYLKVDWLQHAGFAVTLVSFVFIIIAQRQMAKSWRIGIDYTETTDLITEGLFKYSRNPIFLGVMVSYFGTFLIIPNALSFALMLVTFVVLQIQIRLEEEYLLQEHSEDYKRYMHGTRRWI